MASTATIGTTSTTWQPEVRDAGYIMSSFIPNWTGNIDPNRGKAYYQVIAQEVNVKSYEGTSDCRVVAGTSFGSYNLADVFTGNVSSSFSLQSATVSYLLEGGTRYYAGARTTDADGLKSTRVTGTSFFTVRVASASSSADFSDSQQYVKFSFYGLPNAPTSAIVSNATSSSLTVSWTAPSQVSGEPEGAVSRYVIQRSVSGGAYSDLTTTTSTSYTDTGLSSSTSYSYRISAENGLQNANNYSPSLRGPYSNTASGTTSASILPPTWSGSLASGRVGVTYGTSTITASTATSVSRTSGSVPPGLSESIGSTTYSLTGGRPTTSGSYPLTITATNAGGSTPTSQTVSISPPYAPSFSGTSFTTRKVGTYETSTINVANTSGATNVSTSVSSVAGLTVSTGTNYVTLAGTPNQSGTFTFSATAYGYTDGGSANTTTATLSVTINPLVLPTWSDTSLSSDFKVGVSYATSSGGNNSVSATDATGFSVVAGSLPAGISGAVSGSTYTLSGTPTTRTSYSFTLRASNGDGDATPDQNYSGLITHPPFFTDETLAAVEQGRAYSDALVVSTSTAITWSITSGTLPAGLTAVASGTNTNTYTISGTPTGTGAYSFTVRATNGDGFVEKTFSGDVLEVPNWVDDELGSFVETVIYQDFVEATNSPTYAVQSGSLPTGISLNTSTGEVSGTPTVLNESFTFTIRATNADGFIEQTYTGTVQPDLGGGVKVYDGTAWNNEIVYAYDGADWVEGKVYRYNGSIWVKSLF